MCKGLCLQRCPYCGQDLASTPEAEAATLDLIRSRQLESAPDVCQLGLGIEEDDPQDGCENLMPLKRRTQGEGAESAEEMGKPSNK